MPPNEPRPQPATRQNDGQAPKPGHHSPMPRDERGWRVSPAPDGRGMPERQQKPKGPSIGRGLLIFFLVLLALNIISVLAFRSGGRPRVSVPYNPTFLT